MATDARTPAVIVCERSGRIATALRGRLHPGVPVLETRGSGQCLEAFAAKPASIVIAEARESQADRALRLLTSVARAFSLARCVVVAERQLEPAEAALREAGAVHVQFGLRDVDTLVGLVHRHAPRFRHPPTMLDEIWQQLPWSGE